MTHTPTPWTWMAEDGNGPVDDYGCRSPGPINPLQFKSQGYGFNPELIGANGETVISAGGGEYTPYYNRNDAVFIAKACNLHDELVAVVRQLVERGIADAPTMEKARAALAKAQE